MTSRFLSLCLLGSALALPAGCDAQARVLTTASSNDSGKSGQAGAGSAGSAGSAGDDGKGAEQAGGNAGQAGGEQGGAAGDGKGGDGQGGDSGGAGSAGSTVAQYFARFTYQQGQEKIGDFCAAYETDKSGAPVWSSELLFASNKLEASDKAALDAMTAYLPLKGKPVAFGFVYPGNGCETALGNWGPKPQIVEDVTHYTVVAAPYSGEMTMVWAVPDPVESNAGAKVAPGVRIVNASQTTLALSATHLPGSSKGVSLGEFPFGNVPGSDGYVDAGQDHMAVLRLSSTDGTAVIDWTGLDLLPLLTPTTIYLGGFLPYTALACSDVVGFQCFFLGGQQSK